MISPVQNTFAVDQAQGAATQARQSTNANAGTNANVAPQDKVTISESAQQAQTDNTKSTASDTDHDGDSR